MRKLTFEFRRTVIMVATVEREVPDEVVEDTIDFATKVYRETPNEAFEEDKYQYDHCHIIVTDEDGTEVDDFYEY